MQNWGGNVVYRADRVHRPPSVEQLRAIVVRSGALRVIGSRHSFNRIADGDELVDLSAMPDDVVLDCDRAVVRVGAQQTYGRLAVELDAHGMALHNLASLPHISIGGAIATATHGSGPSHGNLATAVRGMEIMRSDGNVVWIRGDELADTAVHAGALGVVLRLELAVEPAYEVRQNVFERIRWADYLDDFDAVMSLGTSVSTFTTWGAEVDQVWVKQRLGTEETTPLFGTPAATVDRHPIAGHDPTSCTSQRGVPGPWFERLPHFRMGFSPSSGSEIQSEWHVARDAGVDAIEAIRVSGRDLASVLLVGEIRTVASDRLLLSPQHDQDTVSLHFTWANQPSAVARAVERVEAALEPFAPRAHLGKVFSTGATGIDADRRERFMQTARAFDPAGVFWNGWLEANLGSGRPQARATTRT